MHLRPRREDDVARCVEIMRLTHVHSEYPIYWPDDPVEFLCSSAMLRAWVAVDDDHQIVGHVALHKADDDPALRTLRAFQPTEADDYGVISRLLVDPEAQGRGLGKLLLDTAVHHSFGLGQHPILNVTKNTEAAVLFY